MNDYLEKHPWVHYTLIIVIVLSINIFWRYNNGDTWTDVWASSLVNTAFLSAGVIIGDRVRRKTKQKNAAAKEKIDELLKKD